MNTTLTHHGILGQKWGVRRYQNKDGSLTAAGRKRVGEGKDTDSKKNKNQLSVKQLKQFAKDAYDYNSGDFEEWYNKGILSKKMDEVRETRDKLTSLLSDKEKKEMLYHLNKANDLTQKLEEHEKHMEEARRIGKDATNRIMGRSGNQKLDEYGNTVSRSISHEIFQRMITENNWVDEWYKETERLEKLEARGIMGEWNKR